MDWTGTGTIIAVLLTLMVYTYLLGDNFVFRLAEHILVGVSVGWSSLQVINNVLLPAIEGLLDSRNRAANGEFYVLLIPLVMGGLLLWRPWRPARPVTNIIMALVVGTVAALSLAGALAGTLMPQVGASLQPINSGDSFNRIVLLLGTLLALWYFQFTVRRPQENEAEAGSQPALARNLSIFNRRVHRLGRWSIMLAFGAVFASVFLTYFAALLDRLLFLINARS